MFGCLYLQLFVSCLIYVTGICGCFCILVFNTYCVVSLFWFSLSCVSYVSSFSGLSIIDLPLRCSLMCISSCVSYVTSFSGLSIIDLPLRCSLMCISSCVSYVTSFSGLSILDCSFGVL